jgi:hypothetical protein
MHDSILSAVTLMNRGSEVNNAENDWERLRYMIKILTRSLKEVSFNSYRQQLLLVMSSKLTSSRTKREPKASQ